MGADDPTNSADSSGGIKRAGFTQSVRLLRHADFERVYKQGKRHFARHMTVFFLGRETGRGPRIGFTVSRAMGGAVDRNRMKRRLREAVRMHFLENDIAADVVINPKKSLLMAEFGEIRRQIERAFEIIRESQKGIPKNSG
ncbi:MAG: ribonuclease P protein component [Terriglobales bacterium]